MPGHEFYLKLAIEEARGALINHEGGPFGAVIVREGALLGKGHNTVLKSHDPTAHAEINAIRDACSTLQKHHLSGAVIYSNFEPCPMCLSAIYWADIRMVYHCAGREIAENIGFMDKRLYDEFILPDEQKEVKVTHVTMKEMDALIDKWNNLEDRVLY